ncbi:MAG: response regulator [Epulopiscium sp.]|nr:response regulator [Candidatus Epulonipiscium sp.]
MRNQVIFMKKNFSGDSDIKKVMEEDNIEISFAEDYVEVLSILGDKNGQVDLIVIDMEKDVIRGIDSITNIKSKQKYKHIPIFIIAKREDVMKGLTIGAQEYIVPPFTTNELCSFIKITLENSEDNKNLYIPQTSVDMSFEQYFNSEIKRAERGDYELAILILTVIPRKIDKTLSTNERVGIINQLALFVKENLRATDTIIRYNESNIIAFLPYTTRFNAEIVYEKVLEVYHEKVVGLNNNMDDWEIIYSIASYPKDGENVRDLLFNAERYLEDKKQIYL